MTEREKHISVLKDLKEWLITFSNGSHVKEIEAVDYAISSLKVDLAYDLEYERTTKNDCAEQNGCITCSLDDGDDCCRKLFEESMREPTDNNGFIDDRVIIDFENKINCYEEDYKFSKEEIINILERYKLKYKGSRND